MSSNELTSIEPFGKLVLQLDRGYARTYIAVDSTTKAGLHTDLLKEMEDRIIAADFTGLNR